MSRARLADLEDQVQVGTAYEELRERSFLVVFVELLEVCFEVLVGEEVCAFRMEVAVFQRVDLQHVLDVGLRAEAHLHVVAEEDSIADRHDVPRHAVVAGADSLGGEQFGFDRTEDVAASFVELVEPRFEIRRVRVQAVADDLVGRTLELNVVLSFVGCFVFDCC